MSTLFINKKITTLPVYKVKELLEKVSNLSSLAISYLILHTLIQQF